MEQVHALLDSINSKRTPQVFRSVAIFYNAGDYPGLYVARLFVTDLKTGATVPDVILAKAKTLEEVRKCIPRDSVRIDRDPADHKTVIENWV